MGNKDAFAGLNKFFGVIADRFMKRQDPTRQSQAPVRLPSVASAESTPVYTHEALVRALFRTFFRREPDDSDFPSRPKQPDGRSIDAILKELLRSEEFLARHEQFLNEHLAGAQVRVFDMHYRCPADLSVTPLQLRRLMVVGQCLLIGWPSVIQEMMPGCECDFFLFNMVQPLPAHPPKPASEYDFQLVGIPLRSVLPEPMYFRLSYADPNEYEKVFNESVDRLRQFLAAAMRWNTEHGMLTFVTNFVLPQQNPQGRLLPRHDLRNVVYFVEKLNEVLTAELQRYSNAYLFDLDQLVATYGRRYFQDDAVWLINHNADLSDFDFDLDADRIEKPVRASSVYPSKRNLFIRLAWTELLANYRTIRQLDMVKLVVVDIDDTLWRGVAVERGVNKAGDVTEGWPIGFVEALSYLKRRGVILAVISKNEESLVAPIWQKLYGDCFPLEEFAIRKINWKPKAENFEEILLETNLLPRSAVYIDDNPVERAAVKSAFPEVRTFGSNPLVWRRILLWSAETQVATITAESTARTEMVRAQVERETQRRRLSREEFLASLNIEVELREVDNIHHEDFPRTLELLNKSNQFNTTGQRWTTQECSAALAGGMRFFVFEVTDRFTTYGIVGVIICHEADIVQYVMSCRVVGMEVEAAVVVEILRIIQESTKALRVTAELEETPLNLLARDLWHKSGFKLVDGVWTHPAAGAPAVPAHIRTSVELSKRAGVVPAA